MAQSVKVEVQMELKSPAEKVYDIFRRKSYLFPEIAPSMIKDVKLVDGDWESVGSVRLWTYVAGDCDGGKETVEAFDDETKSITFNYLDGVAKNLYKTLKVSFRFSPEGESCAAKSVMTYEKQNADAPDPVHGKMEIDLEIKAPADKFHDVFSCRPHHISNVSTDKIHGVDLHDGEWGKAGSVICWSYTHDGETKVAKEVIEAIDDEKNSTTFRVIEGDLMKLYKNFVLVVQARTKEGGGSVVHWTLEYEKLSEEVTEPYSLLQFCVHVSKDIDLHLMEQAQA